MAGNFIVISFPAVNDKDTTTTTPYEENDTIFSS
jgi:hypothetical protein